MGIILDIIPNKQLYYTSHLYVLHAFIYLQFTLYIIITMYIFVLQLFCWVVVKFGSINNNFGNALNNYLCIYMDISHSVW